MVILLTTKPLKQIPVLDLQKLNMRLGQIPRLFLEYRLELDLIPDYHLIPKSLPIQRKQLILKHHVIPQDKRIGPVLSNLGLNFQAPLPDDPFVRLDGLTVDETQVREPVHCLH